VQAPAWQPSVCVHASPSVQVLPSGCRTVEQAPVFASHVPGRLHWSTGVQTSGSFGGCEQRPVFELQVPARWQASIGVQTTGLPPTQAPPWQVSVLVQRSRSLQPTPSGAAGSEQVPVAGSQVPATWHWSLAVQASGAPVQTPDWQASPIVQELPSLHA
jgi:hypothetical protein